MMFMLGKNLLKSANDKDESSQRLDKNLDIAVKDDKIKRLVSSEDGWGCTIDKSWRKSRMEYVIHGPNKAMEKNKAEEPVAMLPAALVDALIAGREKKIHELQNVISSVQEECEKKKLMYTAKLRVYWNLGNGSTEKPKRYHVKELPRPSTAPNLQWGRRRQLSSLLKSTNSRIQSWNDTQEGLFSENGRRKYLHGYCSALPPLRNDLEVQLWIWMEEVDGMETKLLEVESERNSLKEELKNSIEESKILEGQLKSLKINQAKEKMKTLKMKDEIDRTYNCLDECKNKYDKALSSKEEELCSLKKTLAIQTEALGNLQVTYNELKDRNEFLEKDKKENDQLFMKLEILNDELQERQATMEALMKDANQKAENLAVAKENFNKEVKKWKSEANNIREEILRVEQERDDSLAEVKMLREEMQGIQSRCILLEKENLNKEVESMGQHLILKDKKLLQAELAHLEDQLALAKAQFSKEVNARVEIEKKMEGMRAKTLFLEGELSQEANQFQIFEKEIQALQCKLESERVHFHDILSQIKEKHNLELTEEKLKAKSLMEKLEEERTLKGKLQVTLDKELKQQKQDLEWGEKYNLLLQEKSALEGNLREEKAIRKDLEVTNNTLNKDLTSERKSLQKTKEMLDNEVAKSEKTNQLLSESMSEVLKKERLIKNLKDDLIAKENSDSRVNTLSEDLSSERKLLQKAKEMLKDEIAKSKKTNQLLNETVSKVLEKERLIKNLKDDLIAKENTASQLNALKEELASEQNLLQKTKEMLNDEIAKSEKAHQLLNESMAEVLKKEQLIKTLKDDLTAKENNDLQVISLNKDLATERKLLQKTKELLNDEIAKSEKAHQLLSDSMAEVLKKEHLIKTLKDDLNAKENTASQINTLKEEQASERNLLQKTKEMLNDEIAKSEKAHQLLSDSMAEILKKEQLIQTLKDDLAAKEKLILQLKCTNESSEQKKNNNEMFQNELQIERHKCEELTMKCNDLQHQLSEVKKHSDSLKDTYTTTKCSLEMKVANLQEQIGSINVKGDRESNLKEILIQRILELKEDVEIEQESCRIKVTSMEGENKDLKEKVQNLLHKQELHEKNLMAMEQQCKSEIEGLSSEVEDERCQRMKVEEKVEISLGEITKLNQQHEESVKQLQDEFEQKLKETEELHSVEVRNFKEREERLLKEKESLSEDLKYLVDQGASGDGFRGQMPSSFIVEEETKRVEARLQGMKSYHQRLLDEMCSRSIAREAAIQRAAEMEVTRARKEIDLLCHQLEAERCAHRMEKLKLENELKESQLIPHNTMGCEADSEPKDEHLEPKISETKIDKEMEKAVVSQPPHQEQWALEEILTENQEVPVKMTEYDKCKRTNVAKQLCLEVSISSHKNHSEMSIGIRAKTSRMLPNKIGSEGTVTAGDYKRNLTVACMGKGSSPQRNGSVKSGNRKSPELPTREGNPRNIKEDIRATKSDGKVKVSEKEKNDSCKQILETNIIRYLNHVKNNTQNPGKLRANERREGPNYKKGFVANLIHNSTSKTKLFKHEAHPNMERSSSNLKNGMELNLLKGCVPPSEGQQMESNVRRKERVKPDSQKPNICGKFIKTLTPRSMSFQDEKRRNDYQRPSSNTILTEVPTAKRRLKSSWQE